MAGVLAISIEERFWAKVDQSAGPDACWPWMGGFNRPSVRFKQKHRAGESRRPVFWYNRDVGVVYAHRYALSLHDGVPIYDRIGLEASHRCGNYRCCNPRHLYWGTPEQNRVDRYGPHVATPKPAWTQDGL